MSIKFSTQAVICDSDEKSFGKSSEAEAIAHEAERWTGDDVNTVRMDKMPRGLTVKGKELIQCSKPLNIQVL